MSSKLGDAIVELAIKDAKFDQALRHKAAKVASDAALIGSKFKIAFGNQMIARVQAMTSALGRQQKVANALAAAQARQIATNSALSSGRARMQLRSDSFNQNRGMKRAAFSDSRMFSRLKLGDDMSRLQSLSTVKLKLRDEEFRQKLKQARQMMAATGSSGGGSGGMLGAIVGGGILLSGVSKIASGIQSMASSGFEYNSAIEKSTVSFSVLLGSQSRAVAMMDQLRTFAAKTPFELPTLNQAAVSLLATKKIGQSQVLPMLTKLGDAAAGSSEGFASMPRITRAVAQMLTKGKIQAEEMMQLSEAGVPAWNALAEKMGKSTAEVQELGEKGKLGVREIMLLVDGLGDTYKGLADKQSKTYEGMSSTIKDNLGKAFGDVSKPLFELSKKGMEQLIALMDSPKFEKFTTMLSSGIQKGIDLMTKFVNSPITQSIAKFAALAAGCLAVVGAVGLLGSTISIAMSAAPVAALGAALAGIATLFQRAFAGPEGAMFVQMLRESWGLIREISSNISDVLTPVLESLGQMLGTSFGSGGDLQQGFNSFIGSALSGFKTLLDYVSIFTADFSGSWELVKTAGELASSYIQDRFLFFFNTSLPSAIAGVFDGMMKSGSVLVDGWRTLFDALFESVGILINGMVDSAMARIDGLLKAIQAAKSGRLGDAMAEVIKAEKSAQAKLGESKMAAASTFMGKAGPVFAEAGKAFADAFKANADATPEFKQSDQTQSIADKLRAQFDALRGVRDQKREDRFSTVGTLLSGFRGASSGLMGFGSTLFSSLRAGGQAGFAQGPMAAMVDTITKFGEGLGMFASSPQDNNDKKRKSEFVGLADMNKKIQEQLGKSKDNADKKKAMKIAEDTKKFTQQVSTATTATVDTLGKILGKLGMGS